MNATELITLCRTDNPDFRESWIRICRDAERKEKVWIATLRQQGIAVAHPDDGWVNRKEHEVNLVNPYFVGSVKNGSLIVLGSPDRYRTVKIIGHRIGFAGQLEYWKFEEITGDKV